MKYSKLRRIFLPQEINIGSNLIVPEDKVNYINNVLRLKVGYQIRVFNSQNGEFLAEIIESSKKSTILKIIEKLRPTFIHKGPILGLGIIKSDSFTLAIQKSVELGVSEIFPIKFERSQFDEIKIDRIRKIIEEAAIQCERMDIPLLHEAISLQDFIKLHEGLDILMANENIDSARSLLTISIRKDHPKAIVIGPEGGITDQEIEICSSYNNVQAFSLGINVLKTETAAIAALAQLNLITN